MNGFVMAVCLWLLTGRSAMAANAFVAVDGQDIVGQTNGDLLVNAQVVFSGPDVPNGSDFSPVPVTIQITDTLQTIRQKITDAVIASGAGFGYTVTAGNIILPDFQKGS